MPLPDHYATLGLNRRATKAQIGAAYRSLAKRYHPDVSAASSEGSAQIRAINEAHAVLSDPSRRRVYDAELRAAETPEPKARGRIQKNIAHEVKLRIEDFFRGAALDVEVRDPANPGGSEVYALAVPPMTAPGTRFRLPRSEAAGGGHVMVRVGAMPSARYRARGSDLRTELRINARRATEGGTETLPGPTGRMIRLEIPRNVKRGEVVKAKGEGLPTARGGRGDLLVRITYRPEVRVTRH